ncbi:hypothetical protein CLV24_13141 [Pontibacter ummariensis]|uniref:TTHB210-like domain-containing protein n=1 Tax=Pontibacter ummariensis TaxID=1610492 RepID=A0A239KSH8_9BACT|nr:DUF5602 domain-containing protein [Pontibacter ummariensis]PRY05024.1 hypothetical protein CLV24_13141 [Pontibacter ummariensis]SNT21306.1 hypothetical protein SAMN06296052_13141 [Pontibacter ummariensis]
MKKLSTFLIALAFSFASCEKAEEVNPILDSQVYDKATQATTYYSPAKPLGDGIVRTWVTVGKNGVPTAIGVSMSDKALLGLPQSGEHHQGSHNSHETVLEFPKAAELTPFKFVTVDWNPSGHEPANVYDKPHFDFHFYMISNELRKTIPGLAPTELDPAPPAAKYLPANYVMLPGRMPAMGTHFIDVTSPELHGSPFTQTFIYGGYQSNVIFYEPMVALDYIMSKPQASIPVKQPAAYQKAGYYPKSYRVEYDASRKEHKVYLAELTFQQEQ